MVHGIEHETPRKRIQKAPLYPLILKHPWRPNSEELSSSSSSWKKCFKRVWKSFVHVQNKWLDSKTGLNLNVRFKQLIFCFKPHNRNHRFWEQSILQQERRKTLQVKWHCQVVVPPPVIISKITSLTKRYSRLWQWLYSWTEKTPIAKQIPSTRKTENTGREHAHQTILAQLCEFLFQ